MAAKTKPREQFHLPILVLQPHILDQCNGEVVETVLAEGRSLAPLRVLLERRSEMGFISDLHRSLCAEGLPAQKATDALCHAINSPSVAIRRGQRDPRRTDVLQAIALDDNGADGLGRMILVVTATVIAAKPPEVEDARVELLPVDWDQLDDLCALAVQFETWWRTYGIRSVDPSRPYDDAPASCGWLGRPDARIYRNAPAGWESRVTALAAMLGMRAHIVDTPREAAAQALHERVDFAVVLNGTSGWDSLRSHFESLEKDLLEVGFPGTEFELLLGAARQLLIPYVINCITQVPSSSRDLLIGETIYHRKIQPQPRTYDRFDQGSSSPCMHGAESFVPWSGDKAVKGMQRKYRNFLAENLYHCSRFPKCGMYAAKG